MTKLQEEMKEAIYLEWAKSDSPSIDLGRAAAEVAKRYIETYKQSFEDKLIKYQYKYLVEVEGEWHVRQGFDSEFSVTDDLWDLLSDHHDEWLKENEI